MNATEDEGINKIAQDSENVHFSGYVFHDTKSQNRVETLKIQRVFLD